MKSKLDNLPRYQTTEISVAARLYNQIKLVLIRSDQPLRFEIDNLKNIEIILDHEYWVCVDSSLNDIPIFAWTDFQVEHRDSLHKPIAAKLYSYHAHAELIIKKVMDQIDQKLQATLAAELIKR